MRFIAAVLEVIFIFKVMATSSHLALQYAIKYVRSEKLLPHLQTAMTSKSREIRRSVYFVIFSFDIMKT